MANTLSKSGITTGQTIETWHVTQSIDAFTGFAAYDITLSGSFNISGSINGTPGLINNLTSSHAMTASYVRTSSIAVSSSYAVTASYALNGGGSGTQIVTLQFGHATVANAPSTPTYFGNFQTQPNTNVGRIAISSPIDGIIVSASVDLYTVNPGGSNLHAYKVYKDIVTSPVATTLSGTTNSNINYSSFSEILSSPLNVSAGTPINIEWRPQNPESGLNLNHNVTLVIQTL
jgi:hypothetical protein